MDGKLHLLRVALAAAARGKEWELGSWGIPVPGRGYDTVRFTACRDAGLDELASYAESAEEITEGELMTVAQGSEQAMVSQVSMVGCSRCQSSPSIPRIHELC